MPKVWVKLAEWKTTYTLSPLSHSATVKFVMSGEHWSTDQPGDLRSQSLGHFLLGPEEFRNSSTDVTERQTGVKGNIAFYDIIYRKSCSGLFLDTSNSDEICCKNNKLTFWGAIRLEATSLEELSALISSRITILNKQWLLQSCLFFFWEATLWGVCKWPLSSKLPITGLDSFYQW